MMSDGKMIVGVVKNADSKEVWVLSALNQDHWDSLLNNDDKVIKRVEVPYEDIHKVRNDLADEYDAMNEYIVNDYRYVAVVKYSDDVLVCEVLFKHDMIYFSDMIEYCKRVHIDDVLKEIHKVEFMYGDDILWETTWKGMYQR